jgi:hypothetical protein
VKLPCASATSRRYLLGLVRTRQGQPCPCPSAILCPNLRATSAMIFSGTSSPTPYFILQDRHPTSSLAVLTHPLRASSSGVSGYGSVNVGRYVRSRARRGRGENGAYVAGGGSSGNGAVEGKIAGDVSGGLYILDRLAGRNSSFRASAKRRFKSALQQLTPTLEYLCVLSGSTSTSTSASTVSTSTSAGGEGASWRQNRLIPNPPRPTPRCPRRTAGGRHP